MRGMWGGDWGPLQVGVPSCYYSIWLDPEPVWSLDYDSDRACSAGTGSDMFTVTSVHAVPTLVRYSFFGQSFIMIVTRQKSVNVFTHQ